MLVDEFESTYDSSYIDAKMGAMRYVNASDEELTSLIGKEDKLLPLQKEFNTLSKIYAEEAVLGVDPVHLSVISKAMARLFMVLYKHEEISKLKVMNPDDEFSDFVKRDIEVLDSWTNINRKALLGRAESGDTKFFEEIVRQDPDILNNYELGDHADAGSLAIRAMMRGHAKTSDFIIENLEINGSPISTLEPYSNSAPESDKKRNRSLGVLSTAVVYTDNEDFLEYYIHLISSVGISEKDSDETRSLIRNDNITTAVCICLTSININSERKFKFMQKAYDMGWEVSDEMSQTFNKSVYASWKTVESVKPSIVPKMRKWETRILELAEKMGVSFVDKIFIETAQDVRPDRYGKSEDEYRTFVVNNPFSYACWKNDILFDFIFSKPDFNAERYQYGGFGESPLHWLLASQRRAGRVHEEETLKKATQLIDAGFDVNAVNDYGETPLDVYKIFRWHEESGTKILSIYAQAREAISRMDNETPDKEYLSCLYDNIEHVSSLYDTQYGILDSIKIELKHVILSNSTSTNKADDANQNVSAYIPPKVRI